MIAQNSASNTSPDELPEGVVEEAAEDAAGPGVLSRSLYATGYYLSFGVTYPTLLVASVLPTNNAACHGMYDGAVAARDANHRVQAKVSAATGAVTRKVGDAYDGVAQKVQERVESVQDRIAQRKHDRRLADA